MNDRKEAEILRLMKTAERQAKEGEDCFHPEPPDCCPCKHEGGTFIVVDGKPYGCSCGKCKRYKCLQCVLPKATTQFCIALKKLAMAEL